MMPKKAGIPFNPQTASLAHSREGLAAAVRCLLSDPSDHSAVTRLQETVSRAIDAGERHFLLDLTEVPYMDSTALGLFVDLLLRVRGDGGTIKIVGARPSVRRVFEITCLSHVFGMTDMIPPKRAKAWIGAPGAWESRRQQKR